MTHQYRKRVQDQLYESLKTFNEKTSRIKGLIEQISKKTLICGVNPLLKHFKIQKSFMNKFKQLILVHQMINDERHIGFLEELILEIKIDVNKKNNDFKKNEQFYNFLIEKILSPYKLYLCKRIQFAESKDLNPTDKVYQIFNLLKRAGSFIEVVYPIGRYYMEAYNFIIDFTLVLALDIYRLYTLLGNYISFQIAASNLTDLEKLNEELYTLFYNKYFHKYVCYLSPTWINTESIAHDLELETKQEAKKNKKIKIKKEIQEKIKHQIVSQSSITKDNSILMTEDTEVINEELKASADTISSLKCIQNNNGTKKRKSHDILQSIQFIEHILETIEELDKKQENSIIEDIKFSNEEALLSNF